MRGFFIYGHAFEGEFEGEAVFDLDLPLRKKERKKAGFEKKRKEEKQLPSVSPFFLPSQPNPLFLGLFRNLACSFFLVMYLAPLNKQSIHNPKNQSPLLLLTLPYLSIYVQTLPHHHVKLPTFVFENPSRINTAYSGVYEPHHIPSHPIPSHRIISHIFTPRSQAVPPRETHLASWTIRIF
jgi:hypothetical protein